MSERRCANCEFFLKRTDHPGERFGAGYCVRYPPRFSLEDTLVDGFPNVQLMTWCGEFKPRPAGGAG
jgi:hypothetical protein